MPRVKITETPEAAEAPESVTLHPHTVIIDGHDHTIFAADLDDLQEKVAKIKA